MENEELEVVETEDTTTETEETVVDDGKSEFEYDENGDVIVPDVAEEEEESDDEEVDIDLDTDEEDEVDLSEEEEEEEDGAQATTETETETEEEKVEEEPKATTQTSREKELEAKIEALERQAKDTLKKLGIATDNETALEGLQRVAAEASDMTLDEYKTKQQQEQTLREAENLVRQRKFAELKAADLSELKKSFPHLADVKDLEKIDNFLEFASLRDKGLTPKQAYLAANPDEAFKRAEGYNKAKARNDSKAHLRSAVPVGAKDNSIRMSKAQLAEWREIFPALSDKEIAKLYAKTKPKD